MSNYNGRDYLSVIWKDADTGARFEIGRLSKNGCYEFSYIKDNLIRAKSKGFEAIVAFPDFDKTYENIDLFPAFSSRLPDRRRKDISVILSRYGLETFDAFELLRKSGGKLPTDTLEFIDPIFFDASKTIVREFFVAGTRHRNLCDPDSFPECMIKLDITIGENLLVMAEPDNEFDQNAVLIVKNASIDGIIGYVPAYYAEAVAKAINNNQRLTCTVLQFDRTNCQECIKVSLKIDALNMHA